MGFYPRARGGRDTLREPSIRHIPVSIHAPAGGATLCRTRQSRWPRGFYPRARGGRDFEITKHFKSRRAFLSTRPRGARQREAILRAFKAVSIHAPAGGATCAVDRIITQDWFLSTRPRGARLPRLYGHHQRAAVSIHAPAGGATRHICLVSSQITRFLSTRPRGARQ